MFFFLLLRKRPRAENEESLIRKILEESEVWENGDCEDFFLSWETGREEQVNFVTTRKMQTQAEAWLDKVFDYFLQTYGAERCAKAFNNGGGECLPRRESKQRVRIFITDYIRSLDLTSEDHWGADDKAQKPPARPRKRGRLSCMGRKK